MREERKTENTSVKKRTCRLRTYAPFDVRLKQYRKRKHSETPIAPMESKISLEDMRAKRREAREEEREKKEKIKMALVNKRLEDLIEVMD